MSSRNDNAIYWPVCLYLAIVFLTPVSPASAVKLISVRPLFELTAELDKPSDVSVSKDGLIYVVDGVNDRIRIFSQKGKLLSSFGRKGSGDGELRSPLGIDIGSSGKVYIADSGNHRIQIFSSKGDFIRKIDIPPGDNHPSDPTDVVVDESRNRCYVVDNDNHRILAYDLAALKLLRIYGTPGTGKNAFRYPFLITMDKEKKLYIVDVINTRVKVLSPDGQSVATIGGWGVEIGEFFRPKGVSIDKNGKVYVSDSYMGVIQVFDSAGEFHAALGNPEEGGVRKFKTPAGLFIDHKDNLYVVETLANKVSVYRIMGNRE